MNKEKKELSAPQIFSRIAVWTALIFVLLVVLFFGFIVIGLAGYSNGLDKDREEAKEDNVRIEDVSEQLLDKNPYLIDSKIYAFSGTGSVVATLSPQAAKNPEDFAKHLTELSNVEGLTDITIDYGETRTATINIPSNTEKNRQDSDRSFTEQTWKDILQLMQKPTVYDMDLSSQGLVVYAQDHSKANGVEEKIGKQEAQERMKDLQDIKTPDGVDFLKIESSFYVTSQVSQPYAVSVDATPELANQVFTLIEEIEQQSWGKNIEHIDFSSQTSTVDKNSMVEINLDSYNNYYSGYKNEEYKNKLEEEIKPLAQEIDQKITGDHQLKVFSEDRFNHGDVWLYSSTWNDKSHS